MPAVIRGGRRALGATASFTWGAAHAVCDNLRVNRTPQERRSRRVWIARGIAMAADGLQIVALPALAPGLLSPFDEMVDLGVGVIMIALLGWHVAFLPTFLAEIIPFVDLFPTWTAAVLFATRRSAESKRSRAVEIDSSAPRGSSGGGAVKR